MHPPGLSRWSSFLAPVAASSLLTALVTIKVMAPGADNAFNRHSELALDSVMGSGVPLLAGGDGPLRGGYPEADEERRDRDQPHETAISSDEGEEHGIDDDDDHGDSRQRKHPKGKRWKGWSKSLPRNDGNNQWWRNSRQCFEVDAICHGRDDNEWFYYAPSDQESVNRSDLFQPTMELKCAPVKYDGKNDRDEPRISIKLAASSKVEQSEINEKCNVSPTPTHIVLQSLFNDMIGEFYSRTVLKLYRLMTERAAGKDSTGKLPWEEDIQFYVHIPYGNKKMLDGHRLLLSGMLANPDSPAAKSFLELFVQEEAVASSGSADCQCYEKMVFCGYDVYTHSTDVKSKDLEPARDDDDGDGKSETSRSVGASDANSSDLKFTLWSAAKLDTHNDFKARSCGRNTGGVEYECREWDRLRYFLSTNFVKRYPTLEIDIMHRRRQQLLQQRAIDESYRGDTMEYTVVGLTQRTYRRAWLNLPSILEQCNAAPLERVLCVEINVENTSTPFEQLLLHRSLDVMVGIHGAQLTQAILLPQHAHVLEILPWVPTYVRGKWVQTTHIPTPLGVIFHNTDLNHVGYSLDRSSVPLCEGVDEKEEQTCFLRQLKQFIWENRDFNVESQVVLDYIEHVVLFGHEKERTCKEVKTHLPQNFVLYNVWCSKPYHQTISPGEMVLFHDYHTSSPRDETPSRAEDASLEKIKDREKKEKQARRKQQRARIESNKKDQGIPAGNKMIPRDNNQKDSAKETTDRAKSEHEKKDRRAKRKKRNREKSKKKRG